MEEELLKAIINDHNLLKAVKNELTYNKQYNLANKLREIELEKFPKQSISKTEECKFLKFNLLLRMVEVFLPFEIAYRVFKAVEEFKKKGKSFNIQDSTKIIIKSKQYYGEK